GVARRSNTPVCSTPRALLASRIGALGAPGYFAAGLNRLTTRLVGLFGLSMGGLLPSCAGGQTGGEVNTPVCEEQVDAVGWDTSTPLGFAAAEAVTSLEGTVNVSPDWLPPSEPERADYVTPTSSTTLTFEFTFTAHPATFVYSQPLSSDAEM